ncbi:putative glycolipid-binding domain-containing protein [Larkinella insperata]|uniref:Glycolipid-binding domain-containing protein n=1 Tax=Larkinella insperata TaxID=332158 RepID=A0ABW3Q0L9_9BACT|nr:putative glycolipid-binding domain-containing protein [Larkinella insperata]
MQLNLLWTGREYYSLENCLVETGESGSQITSTIIGQYEGKIYLVDYRIQTNPQWQTVLLEVRSRHSNQVQAIRLEGDGKGNWRQNGQVADAFAGCLDVDLPLTPFTNTLPIRRLGLQPDQSRQIGVIYCDLLAGQFTPVQQQYTRLAETAYHYQNVPNNFEAIIQVDEYGLVVDYPELFVRTAALTTNYR